MVDSRISARRPRDPIPSTPITPKRIATIKAAAVYLGGVNEKTVRRLISTGKLKGYRVGSRMLRVDLNDIDAMLNPIPTGGGNGAA